MPGPSRTRISKCRLTIGEGDILRLMPLTTANIGRYNTLLVDSMSPLSAAKEIPADLSACIEPNGDIYLRHAAGDEATFDVIGVICGACLVPPASFPSKSFPHFQRWIKLCAMGNAFETAIDAREVLYNLLALKAKDIRPRRVFLVGNKESIRPSAEMLTAVDVNPAAPVVDIPPLYEQQPFETALRFGQGKFAFTEDNEVLYFADAAGCDGTVTRSEISANLVDIGQVAQVTVKFRALRQAEGHFIFRELLKSVCILDEGISTALAREEAQKSTKPRGATRQPKVYAAYKNRVQVAEPVAENMVE